MPVSKPKHRWFSDDTLRSGTVHAMLDSRINNVKQMVDPFLSYVDCHIFNDGVKRLKTKVGQENNERIFIISKEAEVDQVQGFFEPRGFDFRNVIIIGKTEYQQFEKIVMEKMGKTSVTRGEVIEQYYADHPELKVELNENKKNAVVVESEAANILSIQAVGYLTIYCPVIMHDPLIESGWVVVVNGERTRPYGAVPNDVPQSMYTELGIKLSNHIVLAMAGSEDEIKDAMLVQILENEDQKTAEQVFKAISKQSCVQKVMVIELNNIKIGLSDAQQEIENAKKNLVSDGSLRVFKTEKFMNYLNNLSLLSQFNSGNATFDEVSTLGKILEEIALEKDNVAENLQRSLFSSYTSTLFSDSKTIGDQELKRKMLIDRINALTIQILNWYEQKQILTQLVDASPSPQQQRSNLQASGMWNGSNNINSPVPAVVAQNNVNLTPNKIKKK